MRQVSSAELHKRDMDMARVSRTLYEQLRNFTYECSIYCHGASEEHTRYTRNAR